MKASCELQKKGVQLTLSAFVYWLWRDRNGKIFYGRAMTIPALANCVMNDVRTKLSMLGYKMPIGAVKDEM